MNCNDLMMNIRETYKECDDRLERNYRKEFDLYPPSKLANVWIAIEENHNMAKAPELGNIFRYMALVGIPRTKEEGIFYKRCTELKPQFDHYGNKMVDADGDVMFVECGTKYSTKSKFCPVCNSNSLMDTEKRNRYKKQPPVFNALTLVKCNKLPSDILVLNELCATCIEYHKNDLVQGSKCNVWNCHDEYKKANKKCGVANPRTQEEREARCKCFDCCNERPMNGIQHATFKIKRV